MFECFSGVEELQVFAIANVVYLIVTLKILIVNSLAWLNSATLKSIFQNFLRHVRNWPRIHRNPRQFTWCSFIHSNESQSRSFLNSLTHRYIRYNKLVLIAWYSRLPQYTWNLTYVIIKRLTFSSILSVIKVHFVTVPWTYRRSWANYLAINVAINLTYNKAKRIKIQSNPAISNSVNSKSPLFRRKIEFPWIYPSPLRFPGYFETPLFRTFFHFPWDFEIAGFDCMLRYM